MGQCLSSPRGETPEKFKGRWESSGGLAGGLAAFDGTRQYGGGLGEPTKPSYTTTADVGLNAPRGGGEDKSPGNYMFMHDKPAPAPLQLERIEEDATLQGTSDGSPLKAMPLTMPTSEGSGGSGGGAHVQRKPISWTRGELVGQGAFGSVFVAMDNDTGELIAVKQVDVPRGGGAHAKKVEDNIRSVEEEVQLLQQFDHPNIVRYLGTEKTEKSLNIFLEYVPGGSIASLLAKFGSFKESVVKVYTKQILLGLEYLHSKGVMHRDIKGANILVDNTGLVKLADFGASKKLEDLVTVADGNKSVRGTPYWMAPEVITQTGHGRQADLWSVACTVLEMATGRPPWSTQYPSQVAAMFHIASSKGPPEIPQHLSPECKDFLYLCFNRDWKARPLASTLLRHPFLADVPVRSQNAGPSPNAAVLVQAWRAPRSSSGLSTAAVPEPSDCQFGAPNVPNAKLAGMPSGAPRISLQTTDGVPPPGDSTAALSPLGHHAASRRQPWDSAAPPAAPPQQQQQPAPVLTREHSAASRGAAGSPVKRPAMSLRASAPAFSGYASVALSQQLEPLPPRQARPAAGPAGQQVDVAAGGANLRSSRESGRGSMMSGAGASSSAAVSEVSSKQQQQNLRRSGSGQRLEREASSRALAAVADGSPEQPMVQTQNKAAAEQQEQQQQVVPVLPVLAATGQEAEQVAGGGPGLDGPEQTPAASRQRQGVQDLLGAEAKALHAEALAPPDSAGNSSGTNKSDYNPMEEPSWLHPHESPLPGEGTPTSALTAGASPQQRPVSATNGAAASSPEVSSCATAAALPESDSVVAAAAAGVQEAAPGVAPAPAAAAAGYDQHPSAEHMVWTNEDGDIDALPWDMGGWSTGSSGEQAGAEQELPQEQRPLLGKLAPVDPVDEDALIGALRRKAHHDVRASMALFEKSLNIPALHAPPSPKAAAAAAAAAESCSPRTIAAVRAVPAPPAVVLPPQPPAPTPTGPAAESIESLGAELRDHRQPLQTLQAAPAAAAAAAADDSRLPTAAAVQHLLSGVRPTATGTLPPPSPLQAAVGGLAELGYGGGVLSSTAAAVAAARGVDRESVWQQELSQELYRVKASTGVPNRRVSMHGSPSPTKKRLHGGIHHQ